MSFGDFATSSSSSSSTRGSVGGGSVARGSFGGVGATTSYQGIGADAEHERLLYVVTQNVQQIQHNVSTLSNMVKTLGTNRDTKDHRTKLRQTVDSTRDLSRDTNEAFKKLTAIKTDNPAKAKIAHERLRKDFETWLKEFQEVSKLSVVKERETAPRPDDDAAVFKGIGSGPNAGLSSNVAGGGSHFTEQEEAQLEQQRIAEERRQKFQALEQKREFERAMIEERDKGIRDIEASVITVNEIFQDLATLVDEQGEMIGDIESNITKTDENVSAGAQELKKANEYQKSSRSKLCWLLLCLVLLCGAVAGGYFIFKK